jgi:hypothetical protein
MTQLTLQEAVERATHLLEFELYPHEELRNVLLEEIERSRDGETWFVTIGFARPGTIPNVITAGSGPTRAYKTLKINASNGELEGMTDRLLRESTH